MRIEDTVCQKLNPAQRRQIANILGWIAALLIFSRFYLHTTWWKTLLCVLAGVALWIFAVYIAGLSGSKFKKVGLLWHRLNNEQRFYVADSATWLGTLLLFLSLYLQLAWWQMLCCGMLVLALWLFSLYLVGIKD